MARMAEARPPKPLPYGRQQIEEDDVEAVVEVLRSDWLTTGPAVSAFEEALAARAGVRHAVAVSSGTAALHAAYFAAGLGPGDEIVTCPLTFVSTASVALQLGATLRLVDVEPETGTLDPAALPAALGPRTRLVVPVDYAGHPADYDRIRKLAAPHGIGIVADGAHSLGARRDGRPAASLADATATSFHPVKPITAAEGGAVLTDRDDWAERAATFRNHGIVREPARLERDEGPGHYEVQLLGLNYRLSDLHCALGRSQLAKLDRFLGRRREVAALYAERLDDVPGLTLPRAAPGVEPGWHLYVVRAPDRARRDRILGRLHRAAIGAQVHYPPLHLHPAIRRLGFAPGDFPVAEDFAARALSLPIFPGMSDADVERVADAVREAARDVG